MMRALIAPLLAAAALALVPPAALAQDAGGQQYGDPLKDTPSAPSAPSAPSTPSSGATASSGSPTGAPASTASASSSTSAAAAGTPGIPRTGFPVGWLAFGGFLLLCGGLSLRRIAGLASL
jgi:hypothetical protein